VVSSHIDPNVTAMFQAQSFGLINCFLTITFYQFHCLLSCLSGRFAITNAVVIDYISNTREYLPNQY
jgi:hypothetical protein